MISRIKNNFTELMESLSIKKDEILELYHKIKEQIPKAQ